MALNKLEIYSSSVLLQTFPLSDSIDSDLFQVLNIDGLDPVKGTVNVVDLSKVDGGVIVGTDIPTRNIVLTIRLNPDYNTWSFEALRQALFSYFMPKNTINMIFYSNEIGNVQISGVVESVDANPFTQEPQFLVSIICPDAYFEKVDATTIDGTIIDPGDWPPGDPITIGGQVPIGFQLTTVDGATNFGELIVQVGDPAVSTFHIISPDGDYTNPNLFKLDTRLLLKNIRAVDTTSGSYQSILASLQAGSVWPLLHPGDNLVAVMGTLTGAAYQLTYSEKYGGI